MTYTPERLNDVCENLENIKGRAYAQHLRLVTAALILIQQLETTIEDGEREAARFMAALLNATLSELLPGALALEDNDVSTMMEAAKADAKDALVILSKK